MEPKRILSKSQINTFLQCPYKWKKQYIDKVKSKPSPAMVRGIRIHSSIEKFYKHTEIKDNVITVNDTSIKVPKKFLEFEERRIESCRKQGKVVDKYFKPLFQELKVSDEELGLRGFIDAVYINPKDDELILIDYKSGKFRPENYDDYRFELCVYAELLNNSGKTDEKVKYIGILFVDADKLFFEELKQETIEKMYNTIKNVREKMGAKNYKPKKNKYCYFCNFKKECPLFN